MGYRTTEDFEVVSSGLTSRTGGRASTNPMDPSVTWEDYATKYMEFTDNGPTIFHAIDLLARDLEAAGFRKLNERDAWDAALKEGTRFYALRNDSSIVAFVVGKNWKPSNGAGIIGTHTDSLTAVVKPTSLRTPVDGYELLGVAPYAGGLSSTWWDRDLGLGGRIVVREGRSVTTKLVRIPHPVARVSTLAPHFGAAANGPFNLETQAVPIVGLIASDETLGATPDESKSPLIHKHSLRLLRALSKYSGVPVSQFLEVELFLYDTQPATLGGLDKEFLFAPRIDDKVCTYTATQGLIEAASSVEESDTLAVYAGYDSEEVGSLARTGARGNFLEATIDRILGDTPDATKTVFYANSFFLSADVNHAVNPGFSNVYLEHHKPKLNVGPALARDPNGNMITDAVSSAFIYELGRRTGDSIQQFQIRNDSRSGGTIGPALSSKTGFRGVDIGIAQLSMHSIRACIGSKDVWLGVRFWKNFYENWHPLDLEFKLGDL